MRTLVLPLVALLAACSDGGGTSFRPSPNLFASHSFLLGRWEGPLRDHDGGPPRHLLADVGPGVEPGSFAVVLAIEGAGPATGELQASGKQWRATLFSAELGAVRMNGTLG